MFTELETVNAMMALLGERPVNDLHVLHPMIPAARASLRRSTMFVQADRWWFNVSYQTLYPSDLDQRIKVPQDTASCDSLTQYPNVAVRGVYLYNADEASYKFDGPLDVRVHTVLPYEDCPVVAQAYISARAKLDFQKDYDGDRAKAELLTQEIKETYAKLTAEHTRNTRANLLYNTTAGASIFHARSDRRGWRAAGSRSMFRIGGM